MSRLKNNNRTDLNIAMTEYYTKYRDKYFLDLVDTLVWAKEHEKMAQEFETKDSGNRQEFATGMVRDTSTNKIRYDLVYMPMFKRWAELMTRGAVKYSANNWKKAGTQEELERFKESAFRHFMTWFLDEDRSEDHGAAVFFNISGAEYVREKLNCPDKNKGLTQDEINAIIRNNE
jgi:hypothetical protein